MTSNENKTSCSIQNKIGKTIHTTLISHIMTHSYSLNLSEEVKKGMTEKALRGELQTPAPIGYTMDGGMLMLNDNEAAIVRLIYDLYVAETANISEIAAHLNMLGYRTKKGNPFQKRTVEYILKNPVYAGNIRWNPIQKSNYFICENEDSIIQKGRHEPIISERQWSLANERVINDRNLKSATRQTAIKSALSGLLHCVRCGGKMYESGKKNRIFRCGNYLNGKCRYSQGISVHKIEKAVDAELLRLYGDIDISCGNGKIKSVSFDKATDFISIKLK